MNEPTQKPSDKMLGETLLALGTIQNERDAYAAHIARESRISDSEMMSLLRRRSELADQLERDLATATQRIAELESRVKQLEGALPDAKKLRALADQLEDIEPMQTDLRSWANNAEQALSPSPPDVEQVRVEICPQCGSSTVQPRDSGDYCEDCGWPEENRTDDAPPVQTEEKPATVPLAVAEGTDAERIRFNQTQIDHLNHEIDKIAKAKIPDFHFLDFKVSTFWRCEKSPIGMCVWALIEGRFSINCRCRYCGGPVERK